MSGYKRKRSTAMARSKRRAASTARQRTRRTDYKGRGFYRGFGKDFGTAVGYIGSKVLGAPNAAAAGWVGKIGGKIGDWASRLTGWGEYHVNRNSLLRPVNARIRNHPLLKEGTHIRHREYIGEITSSEGYQNQYELPINPGLVGSFPWASSVAQNFQQYIVNGAVFEYVPSSGDAVSGTNSALGQVMFAVQYDSLDASFQSKQQILNESWSQGVVPSQPVVVPIECAPMQTSVSTLYVRGGAAPANSDIRMYDLGKLTVATEGQQATGNTLGSLYISYDIILLKPTLTGALDLNAKMAHFTRLDGATPTFPFGTPGLLTSINTLGCTVNNRTLTIPRNNPGVYKVRWIVSGDSAASGTFNASGITLSNCQARGLVFLDSTQDSISVEDESNGVLSQTVVIEVLSSGSPATLTWNGTGTFPANVVNGDLLVEQVSGNYA